MKKSLYLLTLALVSFSLAGCNENKKESKSSEADTNLLTSASSTTEAAHQDVRLKFNNIKVATVANEFKGGTSLADLKELLGEPSTHEQSPAGDVTLDLYTWQFDSVTVSVHLFENSTIARAISNFAFNRKTRIDKSLYNTVEEGISFRKAIEILGEPDDFSEANSTDTESLQAIWVSGTKSEENVMANVTLTFEKDALVNKTQSGLID